MIVLFAVCEPGEFLCEFGQISGSIDSASASGLVQGPVCISDANVCNGNVDCVLATDEQDCPGNYTLCIRCQSKCQRYTCVN